MTESEQQAAYDDTIRVRMKRELRKKMRALRSAHPASALAARSRSIVDRIVTLEAWGTARTIALFMSMPDEVQLADLVRIAREDGRRVALPVVTGTPALVFRAPFDGGMEHGMVTDSFGIAEPSEDAPQVAYDDIDLVVVPALAIDPRGHRIGYGAGYYDHTLPLASRAVRVGVVFDFQLIVETPTRADDVPVDWIVTDTRTMRAER